MKKSLPPPIHSPSSLHLDSINSALLPPSLPTSKSSTTSTTTIPSSSSSTKFMPPHPVTLNLSPIPPMFLSNIEKSAAALYRCKRAVFITGAGISVNAGIPDFRSDQGIYAQLKRKYPKQIFKGIDLFDASLYRDESLTQLYFSFMAELKKLVIQAKETHTHRFLHSLFQQRKLLRCYTQNIDGLEFPDTSSSHPFVQLHGTLSEVVCSVCHSHHPFLKTYIELYQHGDPPLCPKCLHQDQDRQLKKQRLRPLGVLKPAVILYNETHPQGDWIAECLEKDLRKKPDVLVVMGTSLKVHGVKKMVRALAHAVHQRKNGLVILVNRTPLPKKEWENVFDMVFTEDVDSMVKRWSAWMHFYQQRSTHFSNLRLRRLRRHQNPLAYPPHLPHPSPPHAFRMSMDLFQCPADSLPSPLHLKNEVTNTSHEMENQLSSKNTPTHEKYKASSFLPQEIYSSPPLSIDVPCITLSLSKKKSRASSIKEFGFPVIKDSNSPIFSNKKRKLTSS